MLCLALKVPILVIFLPLAQALLPVQETQEPWERLFESGTESHTINFIIDFYFSLFFPLTEWKPAKLFQTDPMLDKAFVFFDFFIASSVQSQHLVFLYYPQISYDT